MDIKDVQEQAYIRGLQEGRKRAVEERLPMLMGVEAVELFAKAETVLEDLYFCAEGMVCSVCGRNLSHTCRKELMRDAMAVIKALLCEGVADGCATGANDEVPARDCHGLRPRNDNTEGAEDTNVPTNDVKEKLVELMKEAKFCSYRLSDYYSDGTIGVLAEHLVNNGVTVQDGKPLEAFLHPIDAYKGLKAKYLVFKADTGARVDNCFVLRPDKDAAAIEALRAYARATDNETLAEDIYNWVGKGELMQNATDSNVAYKTKATELLTNSQQWIPVTERLPKNDTYINVTTDGVVAQAYWHNDRFYAFTAIGVAAVGGVTHWMPLPEPPKGE